jgi:hypothetical protein
MIDKFISYNQFGKESKRNDEFLHPPYTWNYLVWRNVLCLLSLRKKKTLSAVEKILSEEIARYDDAIEYSIFTPRPLLIENEAWNANTVV